MDLLDCLWQDTERGIGKAQLQGKNEQLKVTLQTFLIGIFLRLGQLFCSEFETLLVLGGNIWWCET